VRQAEPDDAAAIHALLLEAATWVDALGDTGVPERRRRRTRMWEHGELERAQVDAEVAAGQFLLADIDGQAAGAIRFQLEDLLFWPDIPQADSAFVHRIVVARAFKGQGVSRALLQTTADRARDLGRRYLRLDCDHDRPKLRALYEDFGFRLHSYRQVQSYYVARYELLL
jgi:GNAT superfamily N-acetyltransferase